MDTGSSREETPNNSDEDGSNTRGSVVGNTANQVISEMGNDSMDRSTTSQIASLGDTWCHVNGCIFEEQGKCDECIDDGTCQKCTRTVHLKCCEEVLDINEKVKTRCSDCFEKEHPDSEIPTRMKGDIICMAKSDWRGKRWQVREKIANAIREATSHGPRNISTESVQLTEYAGRERRIWKNKLFIPDFPGYLLRRIRRAYQGRLDPGHERKRPMPF